MNKIYTAPSEIFADIKDESIILIGGFGGSGHPIELIEFLMDTGVKGLTIVSNNAGSGPRGLDQLIKNKRVQKIICSYPRSPDKNNMVSESFTKLYLNKEIELELTPQGTMVERLRAGGAGLGPFFTPTGYGTILAEGKEEKIINGIGYILEMPILGDFSLIKAHQSDLWGNLTYRYAGLNFSHVMAMASKCTVVQVDQIVELGAILPSQVQTSSIFVDRVIKI